MVSRLRVPSQNAEYSSVNAPWTYFFSPAGPDRSVVSSNPATGAAAIRARISRTASAASDAAFPRQEWTNPSDTTPPVRSAISCRPARPGRAGRPTGKPPSPTAAARPTAAESGTPAGRGATCTLPHAHRALCRSCCTRCAGRGRDLLLLIGPGDAQVSGVRQVSAARAGTLREVVLGPVRGLPAHRRARLPGCFPGFLFLSARSAARRSFRGGFRPGRSSADGGIEEFPLFRDPARSRVQLLPQVSDHRLQRRDPLRLPGDLRRLLPDQRITRILRRAHRSQPKIIPETTHSHHGNTTPAAKT